MLFLASEHLKEIKPLIEFFSLKKEGELFLGDDIAVFVNYGQSGLKLGFKTAYYLSKGDFSFALLVGFSGSLDYSLNKGDFVFLKSVKLLDKGLNPVYNPIDLVYPLEYKSKDGITLMDRLCFDKDLSVFGELIDNESYFFAVSSKSANVQPLVLRIVSDYNDKDSVSKVYDFTYDAKKLAEIISRLKSVLKTPEVFLHTGFLSDEAKKVERLTIKKRLTFTQRQNFYKRIKINTSKCQPEPFSIKVVFLEKGIKRERIRLNLDKFKVKEIDDYVGYFHNAKDRSAVIFANKKGEFLRETPNNYTPDGSKGYSILSAYNCVYDCAYCFLKGYFRSFNPVVFLNFEEYFDAILNVAKKDKRRPLYFYLGTFFDPLALDFLSDQLDEFLKFFSGLEDGLILEVRTKVSSVDRIVDNFKPSDNVIFAFSLSPDTVIKRYEFYTPSLERRLKALRKLSENGFKVGVRFDPIIAEFFEDYVKIADEIKGLKNLHSIEIGFLRFDKEDFKRILRKNPCVLKGLVLEKSMYRYPSDIRKKIIEEFKKKGFDFYLNME
ncbi:SPL family radical SAM protein [Hippea alviniae]|uniref:SPL family radical SAM protein n=1 Tax=Hippea alviniae TaxID=1279027 RepID=UPI0003B6A6E4|nr:radical SAM protein [Hippea alviniae]